MSMAIFTLAAALILWFALQPGSSAAAEHTNALIHSTSPYLLQHAHNPVDWREWSNEAFEQARREDKPIFLSVGYSTCHWCHVMAHKSFEDDEVAAILNEHFVPIKVDREQLPDVDAQYMLATQAFYALSGQRRGGGWPNSVWLLPDGRPFFAGTYFPKPQFIDLLNHLAELWRTDRQRLVANADALANYIRQLDELQQDENAALSREPIDRVIEALGRYYDDQHGGFGDAPKFPPHGNLALLIDAHRRRPDGRLLRMITGTLDAMACGGIHDHIGGGFHRYSTDQRWLVPHFEKMLYDNAQLLAAYADAYELTGDENYHRVAAGVVVWLQREMTDSSGGFYSALDADSEGEEGKCYVWTHEQMREILGDDAQLFCEVYNIRPQGNWSDEATGRHPGTNIPHLAKPIDNTLRPQLDAMRAKLLAVRSKRVPPHLDDKILTSWNGLMIGALARAGYVDAAQRAANFLLTTMRQPDGSLLRSYRDGNASIPGYLDDYAYLIAGLLELHDKTGESRWLTESQKLADAMLDRFEDGENGGFFYTSTDHDQRLMRSRNPNAGGNMPSPNGVAAGALLKLSRLTGQPRYAEAARRTLLAFADLIAEQPFGQEEILLALSDYLEHTGPLTLTARPPQGKTVKVGLRFALELRLTIAPPYHVYGPDVHAQQLTPTRVEVESSNMRLVEVRYPQPTTMHDAVFDRELPVYQGEVKILVELVAEAAGPMDFVLRLTAQPCDDRSCLQPMELRLPMSMEAME